MTSWHEPAPAAGVVPLALARWAVLSHLLLLRTVFYERYPTVEQLEREVYARRRPESSRTRRNP